MGLDRKLEKKLGKNELFQVSIIDMSDTGEGIGKVDGYTWFIKDAVIGDLVEAKVMKTKKSYGFARLMKVLEPSEHRVEPRCPVARQCGGCQLQALSYEEQLRFKERKVYNNLVRIGKFDDVVMVDGNGGVRGGGTADDAANAQTEGAGIAAYGGDGGTDRAALEAAIGKGIRFWPIIGMEEPWRYRNKAQFPFGKNKDGEIITGFYAGRTHAIIEQEDCLLGVEVNRVILDKVKGFMKAYGIEPYDEEGHQGLVRHALIRVGFKTGEVMVCLVLNGKKLSHAENLVERLMEIPQMTSISYSVNQERTNVIMGKEIVHLHGPGYITDYIGDVKYQISPLSFYQVNPVQTEKLYATALEYAGLTGDETVWDLYCGIGTISLFLAQKAKKVYGVEIVPEAIADAKENAKINGIENVEFFVGKAEEVLPELYEKNQVYADVIVVDPPRKGCDEVCLDTIVRMAPARVVYVSCDSATLARDLRYLVDRGYEVREVRGCDMFGQVGHCEVCVKLCRK